MVASFLKQQLLDTLTLRRGIGEQLLSPKRNSLQPDRDQAVAVDLNRRVSEQRAAIQYL